MTIHIRYSASGPRILAAVTAAALIAAGVVLSGRGPSAAPTVERAGAAMVQLIAEEHAVVADTVKARTEAQRLANLAADAEVETQRLAALAPAVPTAPDRVAAVVPLPRQRGVRDIERAAAVRVAELPVAAPLPLAPAMIAPAPRAETGPVRTRLRQLASTVERLPSFVSSAADWISDAVPRPRLPTLPGRQLRASL